MIDPERVIWQFNNNMTYVHENLMLGTEYQEARQAIIDTLRRTAEDDKAREEGRLVVLPCKVGTTVWTTIWWDMVKEKCTDSKGKCFYRERMKNKVTKTTFSPFGLDYNGFGKTVFLTRQEAEAALDGGGEGG